MKHASLFSGIGGFELAASWMGWENVLSCEIDPFCQKVLHHHFPTTTLYGDIRTTDFTKYRGAIDVLTAGTPCQPAPAAGKKRGTDDNRWLWGETFRAMREIRPTWCIFENVKGLTSLEQGVVFDRLLTEMEDAEYEVQTFNIPACAVSAPHRRERIWMVAHSKRLSGERRGEAGDMAGEGGEAESEARERERGRDAAVDCGADAPHPDNERLQERHGQRASAERQCNAESQCGDRSEAWRRENWLQAAQRFCCLYDGVPDRLAGFGLDETHAIMSYILFLRDYFYGTETSTRTREILSELQKATSSESFSELLRRFDPLQEEKILRCAVHGESNDERECNEGNLSAKSQKIHRKELRKMWHKQAAEYPPYQRGLERQCSCEFDDIVRELSSPIALADWKERAEKATNILFSMWKESGGERVLHEPLQALHEVWKSVTDKEIGSFRRHYYQRGDNRKESLKAYGNAIVPQVAYQIFSSLPRS